MAKNHLFSDSLYNTLFQHNLISSDGKSNGGRTLHIVGGRRLDKKPSKEIHHAVAREKPALFSRLNLEIDAEGNLASVEPDKPKRYFLGCSEPNKSIWERQAIEEKRRLKVLRADLKGNRQMVKRYIQPICKALLRRH
ncbi:hypothetical protein CEXT_476131 [Caerostris extrusa]|uniref:Uncharacterized protein n=1 Tax=Caerostris extrusa TaxID=172846 RepID=A0AAV4Q8R5_CAEEX|nr:hypothetical protein CEXT_476131 [Caerostris extrusa]